MKYLKQKKSLAGKSELQGQDVKKMSSSRIQTTRAWSWLIFFAASQFCPLLELSWLLKTNKTLQYNFHQNSYMEAES